ncbi:MAG: hypothetical protein HY744_18250 [Deltaproteobacteria bacterium]|nr:hypothetical protein [Deltaproteobacteria bacterium]
MTRLQPGRASPSPLLLAAALLAGAPACGATAEKREAAEVLASIERVRSAPAAGRAPLIAALARLRPAGTLAERARASCAAAYRLLSDGTQLEARLRAELGAAGNPSAAVRARPDLVRDLGAAQSKLDEAGRELPRCGAAVAELQRSLR